MYAQADVPTSACGAGEASAIGVGVQ